MQLSVKDVVYLSIENNVPGDGFRLLLSEGHRKLAGFPSVRTYAYFSVLGLGKPQWVLVRCHQAVHGLPQRAVMQQWCVFLQGGSHKRWRSNPCVADAFTDVHKSKCMRVDPIPSLADSDKTTLLEQPVASGVFAGMHFLFWVVAFTGPLKNG